MEAPETTYILIDHENVHALDPGDIGEQAVKVLVFLGKQTTKLAVGDVQKLMAHAGKIQLVTMSGQGKNALDFHIAYYVGRITAEHPAARIHIVSKDTGFDPLLEHLRQAGRHAQRSAAMPRLAPSAKKKPAENAATLPLTIDPSLARLITILTNNAKARPRKRKTLTSSIASHFKELGPIQVDALIKMLTEHGKIAIDEKGSVAYQL